MTSALFLTRFAFELPLSLLRAPTLITAFGEQHVDGDVEGCGVVEEASQVLSGRTGRDIYLNVHMR